MPHIIVKLWPGKSEQQKQRLADAIANDVMEILGYGEESVSVGIEEVAPVTGRKKFSSRTLMGNSTRSTRSPDIRCDQEGTTRIRLL